MNKISFFKKVIIAIKDFDKYIDFAASSALDTMSYMLKLVAIFTVFLVQISIYNIANKVSNIYNFIDTEISEIHYEDGNLEVVGKNNEEPLVLENTILDKIIIDTASEKEKQDKYVQDIQKVSSGLVLLNDKLAIKLANSNSMVITYSYSELLENQNVNSFNKNDVLDKISGKNIINLYLIIFGVSYCYLYITTFINLIIYIVLIGFLGYFTAILLRIRIRYAAMCKMVVYSLTLPVILNIIYVIVNTFTGFEIEYFDIIYIAISYIYIIAAILMIKADMIKKGKELQEIIKEQERIREELERKKEEEERQKEEQRRKEEEKKKEEKQKQKEGQADESGEEPQGDNA